MISTPFNASLLTPSLVAAATVGTGFGVFVAACVVDADGSLVDVAPDVPHADNNMESDEEYGQYFFHLVVILLSLRGRSSFGPTLPYERSCQ